MGLAFSYVRPNRLTVGIVCTRQRYMDLVFMLREAATDVCICVYMFLASTRARTGSRSAYHTWLYPGAVSDKIVWIVVWIVVWVKAAGCIGYFSA
jgi:hypothetical protein